MKNHDGTLPLTADRLAGSKVYVELFEADLRVAKLDGLRAEAGRRPSRRSNSPRTSKTPTWPWCSSTRSPVTTSSATGLLDLDIHEATNVDLAKIRRSGRPCRSWSSGST